MVAGFGAGGAVLSFAGYLACAHCNAETRYVFDAAVERETIESPDTPVRQCQDCGRDAELDELPALFFEHSIASPPRPVPNEAQALLESDASWLLWVPGSASGEKLLATPTKLRSRISGNITRAFRGEATVENASDKAVIGLWLSQLQYFDAGAITRWERFISKLIDNGPVRLFDCPAIFMRRVLENPHVLGNAKIAGLKYPVVCRSCDAHQLARIAVRQNICETSDLGPCGGCGKRHLRVAGPEGFLDEIAEWIEQNNDADIEMRTRIEKTALPSHAGQGDRKYFGVRASAEEGDEEDSTSPQTQRRFRILAQVHETTLTRVYCAHLLGAGGFRRLQRLRALKPEYATDSQLTGLFLAEAKYAAIVDSEHVVQTQDVGRSAQSFFATEDFVHGKRLGEIVRSCKALPPLWATEIIRQLAVGVRALHRAGLVHGNISPSSSLVSFVGVAKLFDFSTAVQGQGKSGGEARLLGVLDYLSPRLVRGAQPTAADDFWSLGVLYLHLLTGVAVFDGETPEHVAGAIARRAFEIPTSVPRASRKIIKTLTEESSGDSGVSADEVVDAFDTLVAKLLPRRASIHHSRDFLGEWLEHIFQHQRALENQFSSKVGARGFAEAVVEAHPDDVGRLLRVLRAQSHETRRLETSDSFADEVL